MKGLNIKKLAAVAVGGALVGSALAPLAAAISLERSDVVSSSGNPTVSVVVGSNGAGVSDFVWAGNIAAKVAQLATVDTPVAGGSGSCEVTDLSVDLSVGGQITYSTETSKTYDGSSYPLYSAGAGSTGTTTIEFRKELGSGQLSFLQNKAQSYRFKGSTQPDIIVKETVGIKVDAAFDPDSDVKDLVAYFSTGDFNYVLDLGNGIPAYESTSAGTTKFTDGSDDHVVVPLFGEDFTVQEIDLTSSPKEITLIKGSSKTSYYESDSIAGLTGKGTYAGEELTVKIGAITESSGSGDYMARMELYDSAGNLIAFEEVNDGDYLNKVFLADGDYVLDTIVYLESVKVESTTSKGVVSIITGTNVVNIAHNEEFPWDSTETATGDDYWTATIDTNTSATNPGVGTVTRITIKNYMQTWDESSPLWSTDDSLTQNGIDNAAAGGNTAMFLQGQSASVPGYDFVQLQFDGFKIDQDTTQITIGNGNIVYTDSDNTKRTIPFYIQLEKPVNIVTGGDAAEQYFNVDTQKIYYRCASNDYNVPIADGDALNGAAIDINSQGGIGTDASGYDMNIIGTMDLNGVLYSGGALVTGIWFQADGNCQFSSDQFSSSTTVLTMGGTTPYLDTVYYDDDNSSRTPLDIPLHITGSKLKDTYKYRMVSDYSDEDGRIYLLLDGATDFSNEFSAADVNLTSVDTGETSMQTVRDRHYYWPDIEAMGNDSTDNARIVANFSIDVNTSDYMTVYIDTADGDIVNLPDTELSMYTADVNFASYGLKLSNDTSKTGNYQALWTDNGAKVELTDDMETVTATIPENQIYLSLTVLGEGTEMTVEGGDSAEGLVVGETANLGVDVTIEAINATAGTCTVGDTTYAKVKKVGQLVYSDSPAPAGSHIIVGGYLVNRLSENVVLGDGSTLQEALTSPGERVTELLLNGDIVVAGYTANDTKAAAQELISALDVLIA